MNRGTVIKDNDPFYKGNGHKLYHILTKDTDEFGYSDSVSLLFNKEGELFSVHVGCIKPTQPIYEVIDKTQMFTEVKKQNVPAY